MMKRFEGKVALVTGGGSGIGRVGVLRFAQEGADVVVVDIVEERARKVAAEVEAMGRRALAVRADVSDAADAKAMIDATIKHFGRLDVMFNNAGIGGTSSTVKDMPVEAWDEVIAVNLRGIFLSCKYGIPAMVGKDPSPPAPLPRGEGGKAIVNMGSSTAGWDVLPESAPYMASKEGVHALTKNLALEVGGYGIRVNAVSPGIIQTQLSYEQGPDKKEADDFFKRFKQRIPLRRVGQPEDVAATVAFLASDDARHITGTMLLIDGGQTLQSWSNAPEAEEYPLYA
jgi:NAD(P)-dependent dehydrogenase (short-subunit alcohol dehydrogenase family)